jgi:hypothetical protein
LFPDNAEERIELVILTASVDKPKDDFNFFPTSEKVIRQMLDSVSFGLVIGCWNPPVVTDESCMPHIRSNQTSF